MLRGFVMRGDVSAALTTPITHMFTAFALAVIIYISMQDTLAARATVGEFASFITAMLMLLAPLKHLTEINNALQRGLAAAESVFGLIDAPVEDDRGTVTLGRASGELEFEDVSFTYPDAHRARARRHRPAHPARRDRRAGRRLGRRQDHAGQPAAALLCARARGRILLDGHDLQSLTLDSLRANIALVSQEIVLFNDSIFANIAYGGMGGAAREGRDRRGGGGARHGVHPRDARGPQHADRRERPAPFGRPAPAPGDRARASSRTRRC